MVLALARLDSKMLVSSQIYSYRLGVSPKVVSCEMEYISFHERMLSSVLDAVFRARSFILRQDTIATFGRVFVLDTFLPFFQHCRFHHIFYSLE